MNIQFNIQTDSDIPSKKQLFDQIQFAIASRQYSPGHRLPSTRQLAMITGLHRNTISKVYQQLEEAGLVESVAGSGIYVKTPSYEGENWYQNKYSQVQKLIRNSLDELLSQGCSLTKAKELFLAEIEWRLRCAARVLVTVPEADLGAGELMVSELQNALDIPVQLVVLTELTKILESSHSLTILTSRYFIADTEAIVNEYCQKQSLSVRVIPIDIYNYTKELEIIKNLPKNTCVGIVSLSSGILRVAEVLIYSLRGDEILILTAQIQDNYKLKALVRSASIIISDQATSPLIKEMLLQARDDLIRQPRLIESDNYISAESINILKRELGL
ncbi:MAG: GntR family transcriptional regulator [Chloroflexi bacterium AL-N10]|nr:GntR family transcriptional regulator [Chloroflexi bacterium AL-N10]NOK92769.1 GntR family transcriptional regulator [Chloroflexi bacterium AL-N15]